MNNELIIKGKKAKEASYTLSFASTNEKNNGLLKMRMCFEIFSTCVILKKENREIPIILKTRFVYYSVDIICREEFYKSYEVKIST